MDANELKSAFQSLLPLPDDGAFWTGKRAELRERIASSDVAEFLTWPTIVSTMFVGDAPYIHAEMDALMANDKPRWEAAIAEDDTGSPARLLAAPWTSGNLVHQAYHLLRWEQHTGKRVDGLRSIIEIGGGYGVMAKVARRAGFDGKYLIYDVPEFSLIQRYYLEQCGIEAEYETKPAGKRSPSLLIALWSLSEIGDDERRAWLDSLKPKGYLVAAYGDQESRRLATVLGSVDRIEISHLPGNYYLLG